MLFVDSDGSSGGGGESTLGTREGVHGGSSGAELLLTVPSQTFLERSSYSSVYVIS